MRPWTCAYTWMCAFVHTGHFKTNQKSGNRRAASTKWRYCTVCLRRSGQVCYCIKGPLEHQGFLVNVSYFRTKILRVKGIFFMRSGSDVHVEVSKMFQNFCSLNCRWPHSAQEAGHLVVFNSTKYLVLGDFQIVMMLHLPDDVFVKLHKWLVCPNAQHLHICAPNHLCNFSHQFQLAHTARWRICLNGLCAHLRTLTKCAPVHTNQFIIWGIVSNIVSSSKPFQ